MIAKRNEGRYEWLLNQFQTDSSSPFYIEVNHSLNRIFTYIYDYTLIMYIEDIDEEILYDYIQFQSLNNKEIGFVKAIKDVKLFIYFLKYIKRLKNIPSVDFSIKQFVYRTKIHRTS